MVNYAQNQYTSELKQGAYKSICCAVLSYRVKTHFVHDGEVGGPSLIVGPFTKAHVLLRNYIGTWCVRQCAAVDG